MQLPGPVLTTAARGTRLLALSAFVLGLAVPALVAAAGPPFPPPIDGQAVYDEADVFRPATEARAEAVIDAIEERTGAEVVVYSQLVPSFTSDTDAEADAIALTDQWGVGRRGFDDGLVILFDIYESDTCHGRVQLYAGPGYRAAFLSNSERQAVFEEDMVPLLRACDLDGALLAALAKVDANATPEHAAVLELARQANATLGLLVAPLLFLLLSGWALWHWLRFGRDPVYLDDPSIHLPAPPPGLTPAAGAVVRDGNASRRALTAAMMSLAARNALAFEPEKTGILGLGGTKVTLRTDPSEPADAVEHARLELIRRRPIDPATSFLQAKLVTLGGTKGEITPTELLGLGTSVPQFDKRLEAYVVAQGWFREPPAVARSRWQTRGFIAITAGIVLAAILGTQLPSDGLVLVGIAAVLAGIVQVVAARVMPARTLPGAMIRAMLEAYRRTLEKTMAQARSMQQVVEQAAIPLLEAPDDAVAWGVALGLQDDVERVLERTAEDLREGRTTDAWMPRWYGGANVGSSGSGGGSGFAPGLMSGSAIPNFSGMMAALTTVGNSPSSSGSGGGFSGGSSGGGGGGAGGGF